MVSYQRTTWSDGTKGHNPQIIQPKPAIVPRFAILSCPREEMRSPSDTQGHHPSWIGGLGIRHHPCLGLLFPSSDLNDPRRNFTLRFAQQRAPAIKSHHRHRDADKLVYRMDLARNLTTRKKISNNHFGCFHTTPEWIRRGLTAAKQSSTPPLRKGRGGWDFTGDLNDACSTTRLASEEFLL